MLSGELFYEQQFKDFRLTDTIFEEFLLSMAIEAGRDRCGVMPRLQHKLLLLLLLSLSLSVCVCVCVCVSFSADLE